MNVLVALLFISQAASQPSQPALPTGGSAASVTGQVTIIVELEEHRLKTQESWTLSNPSGKSVAADQLSFPMPEDATRLSIDEDIPGFKAAEDATRIYADRPLSGGQSTFAGAYFWPMDGDTARWARKIPVNVNGMRLIIENVDGLTVESNLKYTNRVRELNGLNFAIFDFEPMPAGQVFDLTVTGLPSKTTLPRTVTLALVFSVVVWVILSLLRKPDSSEQTLGPLSAQARRDQIIKALELLEADKATDKVKPKRYERRHNELMAELAKVLREIDLARPASGGA